MYLLECLYFCLYLFLCLAVPLGVCVYHLLALCFAFFIIFFFLLLLLFLLLLRDVFAGLSVFLSLPLSVSGCFSGCLCLSFAGALFCFFLLSSSFLLFLAFIKGCVSWIICVSLSIPLSLCLAVPLSVCVYHLLTFFLLFHTSLPSSSLSFFAFIKGCVCWIVCVSFSIPLYLSLVLWGVCFYLLTSYSAFTHSSSTSFSLLFFSFRPFF